MPVNAIYIFSKTARSAGIKGQLPLDLSSREGGGRTAICIQYDIVTKQNACSVSVYVYLYQRFTV